MSSVAGVVLAAGSSQRMGQPKQLLSFRDKPMLQHVIDTTQESDLAPIVIVTGAHELEITEAIQTGRCVVVHNPDHASGNMSSLSIGVTAAPEATAYVVVMGDQPTLNPLSIEHMVRLWGDERPWAAVTEYTDRIGHPFLLSRDAIATAIASPVPKRLWRLLTAEASDRVVRLPATGSAPIDVNTPADYRRLITG
jgi:molybdenum cofactor cytidylyltransferase